MYHSNVGLDLRNILELNSHTRFLILYRVKVFEEKLSGYSKEVEAFRKKEVIKEIRCHCVICLM